MFSRVQGMIGEKALSKLQNSSVALFGIGGVGGYAFEALVRSGVGKIFVFDGDSADLSNLNRQIIVTYSGVGEDKVTLAKKRATEINPRVIIEPKKLFVTEENIVDINFKEFSYVIDAIDTVKSKLVIIKRAKENNVPVISCMGTGGKMDITKLCVSDISKTNGCPLARVMRRELKKMGISNVKVVYSPESVTCSLVESAKSDGKKAPSSMIFVPATAGLLLAEQVILDLIGEKE